MQNEEIAIIGIGAHYPGASNIKKLWENIIAKREQFRRFPDERLPIDSYCDLEQKDKDKSYVTQGTFIDGFDFDWQGYRIPKKTVESTDIVHWLTYTVAFDALADAGYTKDSIAKDKAGVILGNTLTGEETRTSYLRQRWPYVERVMKSAAKDLNLTQEQTELFINRSEEYYKSVFPEMTEDSLAGGLSNTIAGRVCNAMDLHGGGYTVDGACSSSLIAICTAAEKLSSGVLDIAIAGGVDVSLDTFEMVGFARTGALTPDVMRVYDRRGNGFMPGEGCGLIIMKRLCDARKDGDKVYATIKGWGISSDGKGGITAPNGIYQGLALERAYEMAGYSASEIDFIEGHGTGTTVGDREELKGIAINVGTQAKDGLRSCGVTSFKSICGHTKAASGVGGLIKATLALNQRIIPPTAGCEQPNLSFNEPMGKGIYPILLGEVRDSKSILRAGVSAMGFGGINTHITLESADAPFDNIRSEISSSALLVTTQKSEIYPLCANSTEALTVLLKELKKEAFGMSIAELPDLASEWSHKLSSGHIRAVLIVNHPNQLQSSLEKLIKYLEKETLVEGQMVELEPNQILLSHTINKTRLGFIYPGQGSQQLNMAYNLVHRFDWAKDMLDEADAILKTLGWKDKTLSNMIYRPMDRALDEEQKKEWFNLLTNTDVAQPAICFASALWTERLKRLGIEPTVVGGHSLGELSAFSAAGAFDYKSLISLAQLRGSAMQNTVSRGSMAAVLCSLEKVESLCSSIEGYLTVANINSPEQIVVSGETQAIEKLISLATSKEIRAKKLNVSNAFHSKLVDEASKILHNQAPIPETLTSNYQIISSVTTKKVDPDMNLVKYFGDQVLSRVDFIGLIQKMRNECDMFVEVGPGHILSGMVSYIDKSLIALPVESEAHNDGALNKFLAHYFVSGGEIIWEELYSSRLIREFTSSSDKKFIESDCEKTFDIDPLSLDLSNSFNAQNRSQGGTASLTEVINTLQLINDSKIIDAVAALNGSIPKVSKEKIEKEKVEEKAKIDTQENKTTDVLFKLIEQMTGFPQSSLDLDLRLLDDLNLDSIKATELIADIREELGVGMIDPAPLANATLQEIIETLDSHTPVVENIDINSNQVKNTLYKHIEQMTGFPQSSLDLDLRLLDDLNLDSIKATELIADIREELGVGMIDPAPLANATLQEIIDVLNSKQNNSSKKSIPSPVSINSNTQQKPKEKPWVRNFIMKPVIQSISEDEQKPLLENSRILIISQEGETDMAEALKSSLLQDQKIKEINSLYFEAIKENGNLISEDEVDYIFIILPRNSTVADDTKALHTMVERLSILSKLKNETMVCFAQFAGGLFGRDNVAVSIEQSGSLAWASSLHLEQQKLKVRVIDFDKSVNAEIFSKKLIFEVSTGEKFYSAGYKSDMNRYVSYPELHQSRLDEQSSILWSNEDVVLVTGGAKGITAECALAFAQSTKVKMALVGSSKVPDLNESCEINSTLKRFRDLGLETSYYSCDLSNQKSVNSTIDEINSMMGEVSAIIHGAALNNPSPLSTVSSEMAKKEVAPKVLGAINLLNNFEHKPLKMFASLTSIIGVSGMIGNGWYGFSNEVLDILAAQYANKHSETKVVSAAFSVWGEVGMGAKMGSADYLEKKGIMAIPTDEGVERFLQLLFHDSEARQVVITAKLEGLDTWKTKKFKKPYSNRYLESIIYQYPGVNVISEVKLTLEKDNYLKDHVWKGSNLFPTVFGLEAMAQVVAYVTGITTFENLKIEDIKLERPIVVHPTKGVKIQINALVLEKEENDALQKVKVSISTEKSQFQTEHFSAIFVLDGAVGFNDETAALPIFPKERLPIDAKKDFYSWLLFQGPLFQRLVDFYQVDNDISIFNSLTQSDEEKEWMLGSPYVRDSLLQSIQPMIPHHTSLPVSIDRMYISNASKALPSKIKGVTFMESLIDEEYRTSVYAIQDENIIYEKLEGYRLKILDYRDEFPHDMFFAEPKIYDELEAQKEIEKLTNSLDIKTPIMMIKYIPTLSQMSKEARHKTIKPMLEEWLSDASVEAKVNWNEDGKPILENDNSSISLSHCNSYLLMLNTQEKAGCDIENIIHRSSEKWHGILNLKENKHQAIMDIFLKNGDSEDMAGTRYWSIRESIFKAIGDSDGEIELKFMKDEVAQVSLKDVNNSLEIISLPIRLKRGGIKMLAFTVEEKI